MKDTDMWRIFSETGEPYCYLLYKSAKERKKQTGFPPQDAPAFNAAGAPTSGSPVS